VQLTDQDVIAPPLSKQKKDRMDKNKRREKEPPLERTK
jgi:hypothetical protein